MFYTQKQLQIKISDNGIINRNQANEIFGGKL